LNVQQATRIAELFKALASTTRVRIIARLLAGEACVHELTDTLELNQPAISHQLRLLRHMHIVRARKQGRHVYYELDDAHVRALFAKAHEHALHA